MEAQLRVHFSHFAFFLYIVGALFCPRILAEPEARPKMAESLRIRAERLGNLGTNAQELGEQMAAGILDGDLTLFRDFMESTDVREVELVGNALMNGESPESLSQSMRLLKPTDGTYLKILHHVKDNLPDDSFHRNAQIARMKHNLERVSKHIQKNPVAKRTWGRCAAGALTFLATRSWRYSFLDSYLLPGESSELSKKLMEDTFNDGFAFGVDPWVYSFMALACYSDAIKHYDTQKAYRDEKTERANLEAITKEVQSLLDAFSENPSWRHQIRGLPYYLNTADKEAVEVMASLIHKLQNRERPDTSLSRPLRAASHLLDEEMFFKNFRELLEQKKSANEVTELKSWAQDAAKTFLTDRRVWHAMEAMGAKFTPAELEMLRAKIGATEIPGPLRPKKFDYLADSLMRDSIQQQAGPSPAGDYRALTDASVRLQGKARQADMNRFFPSRTTKACLAGASLGLSGLGYLASIGMADRPADFAFDRFLRKNWWYFTSASVFSVFVPCLLRIHYGSITERKYLDDIDRATEKTEPNLKKIIAKHGAHLVPIGGLSLLVLNSKIDFSHPHAMFMNGLLGLGIATPWIYLVHRDYTQALNRDKDFPELRILTQKEWERFRRTLLHETEVLPEGRDYVSNLNDDERVRKALRPLIESMRVRRKSVINCGWLARELGLF